MRFSQNKIFPNFLFLANCLQIKSKKLQRPSHHNFLIIILFCFVASWDSVWHSRVFVCSLSNLFFWQYAFSPSTRQLPGSSLAMHGQHWTTLIEILAQFGTASHIDRAADTFSSPDSCRRTFPGRDTRTQTRIPGRSGRHRDALCNRPHRGGGLAWVWTCKWQACGQE